MKELDLFVRRNEKNVKNEGQLIITIKHLSVAVSADTLLDQIVVKH